MDTFIKGPSKRDVAGMKAAFGTVAAGDVVSVLYKTVRFGNFLISGRAHATVLDDLMVGGLNAAAAKKAAKAADGEEAFQRQPDKDVRAFPAEFEGSFEPEAVEAADLKHGDLVVASFSQEPYGDFVVTGVVTEAENDHSYLMVGPWILRIAEGDAPRLLQVQRVSTAGTHVAPVPTRRGLVEVAELAS
ncbi:hypothetical protein SLW73_08390 [Glutamicibacter protophormiae]|uniref:hypothetical protein n=1 Tax=Glutamicibacter protophormiae TaxID=37930 RepID=UPI002A7F920F|nr:hypothetical protein [Glutamicibacter protophormiae]WPR66310.1 hypothetical protein SLW72_08395 [Glutamicibacter protophormiae]WPR69806.1 hypothetical protein SLW73_08390 [Glutamicibacter protophormiae]